MLRKLNLGCGEFKKEGYINVDFHSVSRPDVVHDLEVFPYPFADDEFDLVEADHLLEHLGDPFGVMREIHRISKNNAEVIIRVPHFSRGFTHPEHKRGFDVSFPLYFDRRFAGGYQGVDFILKKIQMNWFAQPYLKKQYLSPVSFAGLSFLGKAFSLLANISPGFCSKIWCFWVGGFEEIEFRFIVRK